MSLAAVLKFDLVLKNATEITRLKLGYEIGSAHHTAGGTFKIVEGIVATPNNSTVITLSDVLGQAILLPGETLEGPAEVLADTRPASWFTEGQIIPTRNGATYVVAPRETSDAHLATAGGTTLYVQPSPCGMPVLAFGAIGDGVADDGVAYCAAVAAADAADQPVHLPAGTIIRLSAGTFPLPSRGFCGGGEIRGARFAYAYTGVPMTILQGSGALGAPIALPAPSQGDLKLAVANSLKAGDVLQLRDDTGDRSANRMEIAVVRSASGSEIQLNSALKYTYGANAALRRIETRGRYNDGGCRFRDCNVILERYDGVTISGSYVASRVYLTESINIAAHPEVFDGKGSNVWFGLSNGTRLFTVRGHFQNIDSPDTQGHVKLNCGIHDGLVDITVSGDKGTVDAQNGVHIDTYWLGNARISADYLACSNIRARCSATGIDRSIFVACNPTLTSGAQPQSWDIDIEGAGAPIAVQRIRQSRIVALTPATIVSLYATTDCDVHCHGRPNIFTLSGLTVSDLRVNFVAKPTIVVEGQDTTGKGTYDVQLAQTVYNGRWGNLTAKISWTGHTGAGRLLIRVQDVTPINNKNRVVCLLGQTSIANVAAVEFSATQNASTATPTNVFVLREISGTFAALPSSGYLQFSAQWSVGLFGN